MGGGGRGICRVEVSLDGGQHWSDPGDGSGFRAIPASQILSGSLDGLVSSPTGFDQVITWDSQATFPNQNVANAVLRVDAESGAAARSRRRRG